MNFSTTTLCTYVRFVFLKRRHIGKVLTGKAYIFGHEIKPSENRKLFD